jgi:hypothetical protein
LRSSLKDVQRQHGADEVTGATSDFGINALRLLDEHLALREREHRTVASLAVGSAFEAWLAFEARLLWERNRESLGLTERYEASEGYVVHRYWLANEHKKIDLFIGDHGASDPAECHSTFEFKLIANNKNCNAQADGVWRDLFPTRTVKTEVRPVHGRFAVVGLLGKVYHSENSGYPGERRDLEVWESELERYLLPEHGWEGQHVARVWKGRRHAIEHEWLREGPGHFFQLHLLVARV